MFLFLTPSNYVPFPFRGIINDLLYPKLEYLISALAACLNTYCILNERLEISPFSVTTFDLVLSSKGILALSMSI